jgi:hypothetical protein
MFEETTPVADSSVIILAENAARVIGNGVEFKVTSFEGDMFSIKQDEDEVYLDRDEAEALFLVLDTMLHGSEDAATSEE